MDTETISAIAQIAGSLTVQAVLLYWIHLERQRGRELLQDEKQRGDVAWDAIREDWQRQREREISRQDAKNGGVGI